MCKKISISFRISAMLTLIMLVGLHIYSNAQSLSPSVLPAAGNYFSNSNGSLSFTIGESVIQTFNSGSNILTQGFQQPEVQVRTGSIIGSYCPGNSISVPFLSSGIISASNVFTAQLSNASGSFSSPITIGTIVGNMTSGTINAIIPLATPNGTGYRIRVISSLPSFIGPNNGSNLIINNTCSLTLNLNLFLEGYYIGSGFMTPTLMNESIGSNSNITDTIEVSLHANTSPYTKLSSVKTILNVDGTATCQFPVSTGNYYIAITHRNSIQTWSANPVTFTANTNYNFTTSSSSAYGSNLREVALGTWALFTGDINQDENIDLLDAAFLETDINNFQFGYFNTDLNGDGNVDLLDSPFLEENINEFVFAIHP